MRFLHVRLFVLLCSAGALTACDHWWWEKECDGTLPPGSIGACENVNAPIGSETGPCTEGGHCDPGLTCVIEQCLSCGGIGEVCCGATYPSGGGSCDTGTCAWNSDEEWWTCQTCGTAGAACCYDLIGQLFCADGSTCGVNGCESGGSSSTSCGSGPVYYVYAIDPYCAKQLFTLTAPDDAAAEQCMVETLKVDYPGLEWGLPSQDPTATAPAEHAVCPTGCSSFGTSGQTVSFWAFTDQQLAACEQAKDSTCSWSDGECP